MQPRNTLTNALLVLLVALLATACVWSVLSTAQAANHQQEEQADGREQ